MPAMINLMTGTFVAMHRLNPMHPNRLIPLIAVSLAFLTSSPSIAARRVNGLEKFLRDADQALCQSTSLRCKAKKSRLAVKSTKPAKSIKSTKIAAKPAKEVIDTAKPVSAAPPPIPKPKPVLPSPIVEAPKNKKPVAAIPLPPAKPSAKSPLAPKPVEKPLPEKPPVVASIAPETDGNCMQQLQRMGAVFTRASASATSGKCYVNDAVNLRSIKSQKATIILPEAPLLNCRFAVQFSKWLGESAGPIVAAKMGKPLDKVATGPGFECRGRNGDASAKISEHGYGNAVDISTFSLAGGGSVAVQDANNLLGADAATLKGLRASACGYFTTVLGPGSNAAHATHFHLDLGTHGKSGNYRICE
jgi:hypothetical protein